MNKKQDLYRLIVDSVTEHICVIDSQGWIIFNNKAWDQFAEENDANFCSTAIQMNYLNTCNNAWADGDNDASEAAKGINKVITGELNLFSMEYPCHSADQQRWFMMRVTPLHPDDKQYFVISHQNITQRKLIEERALKLARYDELTGLANRRHFDDFLMNEWRRCARQKRCLSLAFIDIDYFKLVNDSYGHAVGDDCLERIASTLNDMAHRPGDCCARYGGDEFALLLSDTSLEVAESLLQSLPAKIRKLRIPNREAPTGPHVTISMGLTSMQPMPDSDEQLLLRAADHFLYQAKSLGRDQLCSGPFPAGPDFDQLITENRIYHTH